MEKNGNYYNTIGFRDLNNYQYYGSIFLVRIITVYGTSNGPQNDIGKYLGPCSR